MMTSANNPYQSPTQPTQPPRVVPPGERFAPCPQCRGTSATRVTFTMWGGLLGPKLLTHVKCNQCGMKYNGKTGQSNTGAIVIYTVIALVLAVAIGVGMAMMK